MTRTSFNRDWRAGPKVSPFAQLHAGAGDATPVTPPHDAIAALPRSADAPSGGRTAYFPGGVFEYLKDFDVPEEWRGKRVTLEFQGVYRDAMVYVNGTFASQRPSGYTPFSVSLDPFLRYGERNPSASTPGLTTTHGGTAEPASTATSPCWSPISCMPGRCGSRLPTSTPKGPPST